MLTGEPRYLLLLGFHVLVVLVLGLAAVSIRARAGANHILRGLRPTARRASAKVDDFCTSAVRAPAVPLRNTCVAQFTHFSEGRSDSLAAVLLF